MPSVSRLATCRAIVVVLVLWCAVPALGREAPGSWKPGDRIDAELEEEIDRLVAELADGGTSWAARRRLVEIGPPAVDALEGRVLVAQPEHRRRIVTTLSRMEGSESSPLFAAGLTLSLADAVEDLRHDSTPWNATHAMSFLRAHAESARSILEAALRSDDHQQRQAAASVLQGIKGYRPTPRMLAVTVEGLRDDVLPSGRRPGEERGTTTYIFNATQGVHWFLRRPARIRAAEPLLVEALRSDDLQQRFLAAYLLGRGGCAGAFNDVIRVLAPHLGDNHIREDANMAAAGLYGLGPAVVPDLRARLPRADAQEGLLLRLIIHHLAGADDPDAAVPSTARRRKITDVVDDPVTRHRFVGVPWFGRR